MFEIIIYDKLSNERINNTNILMVDSLQKIKEKIFIVDMMYVPELLKIEIKKGESFEKINEYIYQHIEYNPELEKETVEIYVSNLLNIIEQNKENILVNKELFINEIKKEYTDLTDSLINLVINSIQYEENEAVQDELVTKIERLHNDVISKNKLTKIEKEFYELNNQVYNIDYDTEFTNISYKIVGNNIIKNDYYIKLNNIFDQIELDEFIPYISIDGKLTENDRPLVKIYDLILEKLSEKEIRDWIFSTKTNYKKVLGVNMRIKTEFDNYCSMTLLSTGNIKINYKYNSKMDIDLIINRLNKSVNKVITRLNSLNIFNKPKKIDSIENSKIIFSKTDILINIAFNINIFDFKDIIKDYNSFKFMTLNDTNYPDLVSVNYQDVLVHVKENQIQMFKLNDIRLVKILIDIFYKMSLLKEDDILDFLNKTQKAISKKKLLKEAGVNFISRKCQRPPAIIEPKETLTQHEIKFKDKYYKCGSDPKYQYPGFTIDNILCCFQKPQTNNEIFIRNMEPELLEIIVTPSNFVITIDDTFDTYVLKMVSSIEQNEERYFYINRNNILQPITNQDIINEIKENEGEGNMWLDPISLAQLVRSLSTDKCINKPDLTKRDNLDAPCENHNVHKFFGYGANSYPCCFNADRQEFITKKKKDFDITKKHIKLAHKPLKHLQLGYLSDDLDHLLNKVIKSFPHYRIGVYINNNSFLNAIKLAVSDVQKFTGILQFKEFISNYLDNNQHIFNELPIYTKFKSVQNYKNYLNNESNYIYWNDFIDLLEIIFNINIIIIEESKNKKKYTTKIVCRYNKKYNKSLVNIVLLKTNYDDSVNTFVKQRDTFEPIIRVNKDSNDKILTMYSKRNEFILFLFEYIEKTCVKVYEPPENYLYDPLPTYSNEFSPKLQIINNLNKTSLVLTNNNILQPFIERDIIKDIPIITYSDFINDPSKIPVYDNYTRLNNYIINYLDTDNDLIGAIMTHYGYIIPYNKRDSNIKPVVPKLSYKYYIYDLDKEHVNQTNLDKYNVSRQTIKKDILNIKKQLLNITDQVKTEIYSIISSTATRLNKINSITNLLLQFIENNSYNKFLLNVISNEIINDNVENLLLNGIIVTDNNIIRDTETILYNVNDILQWINKK